MSALIGLEGHQDIERVDPGLNEYGSNTQCIYTLTHHTHQGTYGHTLRHYYEGLGARVV